MLYTIIIFACITIGSLIGITAAFDWLERIGYAIGGAIAGAVAGLILMLVVAVFATIVVDMEYVYSHEEQLHALKDNKDVGGSFFLGTGSVSSESRYYFIAKREKGLQMDYVSTRSTFINEDNLEEPNIKYFTESYKSEKAKKWLVKPLFPYEEIVITIPENSITTEFKVDLE